MPNKHSTGIIAWFTRNSVAANLLVLLILVAGISSLLNLRVEGFPSIPPNSITIDIVYDSGSAESAEEGIALKLEEALQGVEGVTSLEINSTGDGVTATVRKVSSYDLDMLYRDVKTKIDSISSFPQRAEKPVISQQVYLENVISVNLFGAVDSSVLQVYAKELRSKLLASSQIQKVNYFGYKDEEITIQVDESKLQALDISMGDIVRQINAASITDTSGELLGSQGKLILKTTQQKNNAKEFIAIPIKTMTDGQTIFLSDIAIVKDDFVNESHLTRYNGKPSVGLNVKMYGKSNVTQVADEAIQIVTEYQKILPSTIQLDLWNNQSEPIKSRLSLLMKNSAQGVIMVVALLALFLNIRVALWVGFGLPVTFAGAMVLMGDSFFGLSLNELTTFGFIMALGIVVDDAVVIGESIYEEREKKGASIESTIMGAKKVATPTTFGVLTTMVAFMSMTLVEGELGKIFAQFAYAAAFCLLFSLIESKLILPSHLAHVRMHENSEGRSFGAYWTRFQNHILAGLRHFTYQYYKPCLVLVLRYRYAALTLFLSFFVLVGGTVASGKIKSVFFPEISSDFISIDMVFKDDAGYGLVQRETLKIEGLSKILNKKLSEEYDLNVAPIESLLTETTDSSATLTVGLSANNERPFTASELAKRWQSLVPALEGIDSVNFSADMIAEKDISVELRSKNNQTIELAGQALVENLALISGVSGIKNGIKTAQIQIDIEMKAESAALGLNNTEILNQLKLAYQGYEVQRLQRGENEVKVRIQYPDNRRQTLDDLQYANIRLPDGNIVPLHSVATISTKYVSTSIGRKNNSRVNQVTADVNKAVITPGQVFRLLEDGLFQELRSKYRDLAIVISGQQEEENKVTQSLKNAFIFAMIAIYVLLAIPLKSYLQPLVIMCAIPFGVVGALIGHMLHGIPISLLSLFGVLALSGVVVNDSLLLISRYNHGRDIGLSISDALIESGTGRLRAILLTSTTTYFGLVPLLLETAPQAQFLIPAATSMGYGILFATIITLVLIPALVMINEDLKVLFTRKNRGEHVTDKEVLIYE